MSEPGHGTLRERNEPASRNDVKLLPEDEEPHQAKPEHRGGDAEKCEAHRETVGERPSLEGGEDADRYAEQQPGHGRTDGELEGHPDARHDLGLDRVARLEREPEPR